MNPAAAPAEIEVTDVANVAGGSARIIVLRKPAKLNCLSLAMLDRLLLALEGCAAELLILTGAGRSFCTGLDLREITSPTSGKAHLKRLVAVYQWFLRDRVPTVVLARGHAAGGGAGLAFCARTVIAAADFRVRIPGGRLAALAAVVIPICKVRAKGRAPARHAWLGSDFDAAEACRLGLVDQVVPAARLESLIRGARRGAIPPEWFAASKRDPKATAPLRTKLEEFLREFPGRPAAD